MYTVLLYLRLLSVIMAVDELHNASAGGVRPESALTDDRYCRHCGEIALAYDPDAGRARCRCCDQLA